MPKEIKKEAILKLQDEPYLKPISNTDIGFYNLDINTAVLTFQVSKQGEALLISGENTNSYAYFKSSNGSVSGVLDLEYKDPLNGIVTITLPKDFLQASSGSTVTGQMYLTVNKWTSTPDDKSDTAVLSEFTFTVKDALINTISGETKIEYIRMFDVLKQQIEKRVHDIEEAIANGADYVAEMKSVLQKGIETLNAIVAEGKTNIQSFITKAKTDLNKVADNVTEDITTTTKNAKASVQDTATNAVNSVSSKADEVTEHVDSKVNEFNQVVEDNEFLSPEMLDKHLKDLDWQKYKITNDNGTRTYLTKGSFDNVNDLSTGLYETVATEDAESQSLPSIASNAFIEIDVTESESGGRKQIYVLVNYSKRLFLKTIHTNSVDKGWVELTSTQEDTGWLPITIKNGYNKSTLPDYEPSYRVIDYGTHTKVFVRLGVTNLVSGKNTIASIPEEFNPYKIYSVGVSTIAKIPPKVIIAGGDIEFHPNNNDDYITTDYIIYQDEWII